MLHVTSTVPEYLRLLEVDPDERERAWVDQYERAHTALFETYYAGYGHPDGRPDVVAHIPDLAGEVTDRETRALRILEQAADDFERLGLLPVGFDVHAVLMVGTRHSNAWVKPVDGTPTLFVALELLPPAGRDDILLVHELVHVAHLQSLLPALTQRPELENHVGMRVWLEGTAVAATRHLLPGRPEHDYFFVDEPDWLEHCRTALPQMAARLVRDLEVCDAALAYSFVGVTDRQPLPSRAGYWLGDRVVTRLLDAGATLHELLTWQPERVVHTLRTSSVLAGDSPTPQPSPGPQ